MLSIFTQRGEQKERARPPRSGDFAQDNVWFKSVGTLPLPAFRLTSSRPLSRRRRSRPPSKHGLRTRSPVGRLVEIERNRATSPFFHPFFTRNLGSDGKVTLTLTACFKGLARYGFLSGMGAGTGAGAGADILACVAIKRVAGTAGFLCCLGFLGSRLLRCRPLGI